MKENIPKKTRSRLKKPSDVDMGDWIKDWGGEERINKNKRQSGNISEN